MSKLASVGDHENEEDKRHRHDVGHVSHGAASQETITKAVQYTLAMCVMGTAILVVYVLSATAGAL